MSKYRSLQETDNDQYSGTVTIENTHQPGATKTLSSSKDKVRLCAFVRQLFFLKQSFIKRSFKIIQK